MRTAGDAHYAEGPLGAENAPALVGQNARSVIATVLENLLSGATERGNILVQDQVRWAAALLQDLQLPDLFPLLRETVLSLTVGQQRLTAIARTLAGKPLAILLDDCLLYTSF